MSVWARIKQRWTAWKEKRQAELNELEEMDRADEVERAGESLKEVGKPLEVALVLRAVISSGRSDCDIGTDKHDQVPKLTGLYNKAYDQLNKAMDTLRDIANTEERLQSVDHAVIPLKEVGGGE